MPRGRLVSLGSDLIGDGGGGVDMGLVVAGGNRRYAASLLGASKAWRSCSRNRVGSAQM